MAATPPLTPQQHPDNPNKSNNNQGQPLFDIAELDQHPLDLRLAWAREALAAGHDANELDRTPHRLANRGRPLHCALREPVPGNLGFVRFLLDEGRADPRLRDRGSGSGGAGDESSSALEVARQWIPVYEQGSMARDFYVQAARMMEAAVERLDGKEEAAKPGEEARAGLLSHVQRYLGFGSKAQSESSRQPESQQVHEQETTSAVLIEK